MCAQNDPHDTSIARKRDYSINPTRCSAEPKNSFGFADKQKRVPPFHITQLRAADNPHRDCSGITSGDHLSMGDIVTPSATKRWVIQGMDCPACAAKLEKALTQNQSVAQVKVHFATQVLSLQIRDAATMQEIQKQVELTAQRLGFALSAEHSDAPHATVSKWFYLKQNALLAVMTLALASAGFLSQFATQWSFSTLVSQGIFTFACVIGLVPIVKKALAQAQSGSPFAIETLMSVAAIGALYLGETAEAAMVLLLFLVGEKLEGYAASRARSGVKALMALVPENCVVIEGENRVVRPASELKAGDIVEISPGGRLPADGLVLERGANFDQSALTGESIPAFIEAGGAVMAGTVAVDSVVLMQVTSASGDNAIDRILRLIEEAESRKAPLERFLDKFSRWYTPLMMLVSALVMTLPPLVFAESWDTWVYRGLTLLLIACPCALVISTPAAITSGLATAAKRGALIKGGAALETLGKVEVVAFDKTGTLTQGKPQVTDIVPFEHQATVKGAAPIAQTDAAALLALAAAVEQGSTHPLARSLVERAEKQALRIPQAQNRKALAGIGVEGWVMNDRIRICSPNHLAKPLPENHKLRILALENEGKTVAVVEQNETALGVVAWQDTVRKEAQQALAQLRDLNVSAVMLTGDNQRCAAAIAKSLNIQCHAELLPADKVAKIESYRDQHRIAMLGDGINDAPAMKAATMGIAMGGGTDVALETADAALTHDNLHTLPFMIALSRATLRNIRQNVALALGLKGLFLITTLLGFTGLWVAVLADSGATALVTLNALRLLRFREGK
ncbi:zinc/cadmium/mercury/lead-transporting ATPase [Vibrio sp. SM6]|uniref:P-type Zn(2+) transporter n=1 Tax=Vibrio agarilyticus TaxID=2726741 RepID=A0A7X8YH73_9VIBR|nr:zinc/cadmium/mercury/lead-transporting ATPase [Vibrio agarilyticus]NLS13057.1 zinc/cadmium/mercury/lead-transporting ATPase [Vibrio agarilyticus]